MLAAKPSSVPAGNPSQPMNDAMQCPSKSHSSIANFGQRSAVLLVLFLFLRGFYLLFGVLPSKSNGDSAAFAGQFTEQGQDCSPAAGPGSPCAC